MDKLYIDTNSKAVTVALPQHGTVTVIVQDGKVIRTETTTSQKIRQSDWKSRGHERLAENSADPSCPFYIDQCSILNKEKETSMTKIPKVRGAPMHY